MKTRLAAILFILTIGIHTLAQVRTVRMKSDELAVIRNALGIATIVQLPETIQSAIIGDQSGFKIEYLDRAVTIKPLRFGARTNLYLQTEKRRYNLRLVTLGQEAADYIVYLRNGTDDETVKWRPVAKSVTNKRVTLTCVRVAVLPQGFVLVDLKITSPDRREIQPEEFWILQGRESRVINGLFLSSLSVMRKSPLLAVLTLAKADLIPDRPIMIELRQGRDTLSLALPKETLWR